MWGSSFECQEEYDQAMSDEGSAIADMEAQQYFEEMAEQEYLEQRLKVGL